MGRQSDRDPSSVEGFRREGPNFYVWDEDEEAASRWAGELRGAWLARRASGVRRALDSGQGPASRPRSGRCPGRVSISEAVR